MLQLQYKKNSILFKKEKNDTILRFLKDPLFTNCKTFRNVYNRKALPTNVRIFYSFLVNQDGSKFFGESRWFTRP